MKKLISLIITLALLGFAGCSNEENPDEPTTQNTEITTETSTTQTTTTETLTIETTTTTEAPTTTMTRPTTTTTNAAPVNLLIDWPVEKITVLKFYHPEDSESYEFLSETVKVLNTNELNAFKACMNSEQWHLTNYGSWLKGIPTISPGNHSLFVEGTGGQTAFISLYRASIRTPEDKIGAAASIVYFENTAPPLAQWRYPLNRPPVNITTSDFTFYAVAHETNNALFALCE